MRKGSYGRGRQWRLGIGVFSVLLASIFVFSCLAGTGLLPGAVFIDVSAHSDGEVLRTHRTDGVLAGRLCETVRALTGNGSLTPFSSSGEGNERCREALLMGLIRDGYSAYVGNRELIKRAEEAYPNTFFLTLIPAEELEARAARCFGGSVRHANAGAFTYLDRVGMYTTAAPLSVREVTVKPISLEETESTYRLRFALDTGGEYLATFEKKGEDGYVWRALREME
jgi:hypothetical protein